jgi:hypothetical protein
MLTVAAPPAPPPDLIPGLTRSPEWHREQEAAERAHLDARVRWRLRYRLPLLEDDTR